MKISMVLIIATALLLTGCQYVFNDKAEERHAPYGHWSATINGQPVKGLSSISYLCPGCSPHPVLHGISMILRAADADTVWSSSYPDLHFHLSDTVAPVTGTRYPMGVYHTVTHQFEAYYLPDSSSGPGKQPGYIWRTQNNGYTNIKQIDLDAGSITGTFSFMVYKINVYTKQVLDSVAVTDGKFEQDKIVLHNKQWR